MPNLIGSIKGIFKESYSFHKDSPSAVFKFFVSTVLALFAVLSIVSIGSGDKVKALQFFEGSFYSANFWWGLLGLFGASSIIFENYIKGNKYVLVTGYLSAILSFALLSYDFIITQPPIYTGGILAATAVVFLGGILYGRIKN